MSNLTARALADAAERMDNDVNGNPRYYIPVYMFTDANGVRYRPSGASMYRGKRYGAGWVFQSYNIEADLARAVARA